MWVMAVGEEGRLVAAHASHASEMGGGSGRPAAARGVPGWSTRTQNNATFAGGHKIKDICQRKILLLCGRERARCAIIELGCSHVVLKINNIILE